MSTTLVALFLNKVLTVTLPELSYWLLLPWNHFFRVQNNSVLKAGLPGSVLRKTQTPKSELGSGSP
jgi:hypothetical protein